MTDPAQAQGGAWLWPGPSAGTGTHELRSGEKTLVLFLDPISLVVAMPPFPGGEAALAQYCRILARTARKLAAASHPRATGQRDHAREAAAQISTQRPT
ncbi:MAG: hypothetical protein ACRDRU_01370 [Pseudonocardiaceae bacterium]